MSTTQAIQAEPVRPMVGPDVVAARLGLPRDTITYLVRKGRLPKPLKLGRFLLWPAETIDQLCQPGGS